MAATAVWRCSLVKQFGCSLSVIQLGSSEEWLIGTEVASLLERETFNMYRSMKIKGIEVKRATPRQVEFLVIEQVLKQGTHSATLIEKDNGLYYIADAWYRKHRREFPFYCTSSSFLRDKPKIDRRKPKPWDVHRSLRPSDMKCETLVDVM